MALAIYTVALTGDFPWRPTMLIGPKQWAPKLTLALQGALYYIDSDSPYSDIACSIVYALQSNKNDSVAYYNIASDTNDVALMFLKHLSNFDNVGWDMTSVANQRSHLLAELRQLEFSVDGTSNPLGDLIINCVVGSRPRG